MDRGGLAGRVDRARVRSGPADRSGSAAGSARPRRPRAGWSRRPRGSAGAWACACRRSASCPAWGRRCSGAWAAPCCSCPTTCSTSLDRGRWPAILAHELAHLRRLDPWVRRLELLAGLVWWWNPLYWLTRRRLDFEAELACDAWVLWALPDDRLAYAESLIQIGSSPFPGRDPGALVGRRRRGPILREEIDDDPAVTESPAASPPRACSVAALLTLLALPSWTLAEPGRNDDAQERRRRPR